ncbi:MAG: hypothetical protein ACUVWB_08760 [Anaerolineae bacterium]
MRNFADREGSGPASEEEILEEGIRKIVTSRERTPRGPQWNRAWWRALVRYTTRLSELRRQTPAAGEPNHLSEREDTPNR